MCESSEFESSEQLADYHRNLHNTTRDRLRAILERTPLLRDIACDITPDELAAEIAFINGDSIKVYVHREPYAKLKVIVPRQCTVWQLKAAIRRCFETQQQRHPTTQQFNDKDTSSKRSSHHDRQRHQCDSIDVRNVKISWKYIWRTYYLRYNGTALIDNEKKLSDYDVRNKAALDFVKKIKIDRKAQYKKHEKR